MCMVIFTAAVPKEWAKPAPLFISGGKAVIGKFPIVNKVMETKLL